jgi:hypothetical protein
MLRYYFHCTDGADLIPDRRGRKLANKEQAFGEALLAAESIMRELPDYGDWASWVVCHDDEHRMIGTVPFDRAVPSLANRPAAIDGLQPWELRLTSHHTSIKFR